MRWWDYAALVATIVISVGLGGLMGAWAAERRLDRLQKRELWQPPVTMIGSRATGPGVNPQKAQDAGEATDG